MTTVRPIELGPKVGSCFFDHPDFDASDHLECPECVREQREAARSAMVPAGITPLAERTFRNRYLSVSRLKRFEQCPNSFELHYIVKLPSEQTTPLLFGTLLHEALERLFKWVVDEEFSGRLPEDKLLEFYRDAWQKGGLSGGVLFSEGLALLRAYLKQNPEVDHLKILGVEIEFNIELEEFGINGRIDRVDKIDDETIAIIDYKSNRLLFSREEVDNDLQMSVYALAAKKLYPWANKVVFVFHMLRHGVELSTERSEDEILDAAQYVVATGRQTETAKTFPAKLNPNCQYCDHRRKCDAYNIAVARGDELVVATPEALDLVSHSRMKVHAMIKILEGRKRELETIIRAQLVDRESVTLGDVVYKLVPWTSETSFPFNKTFEMLAKATGNASIDFDKLAKIDPKRLELFVNEITPSIGKAKAVMLKAQLEAIAEKKPGAPRFQASALKGSRKKAMLDATPHRDPDESLEHVLEESIEKLAKTETLDLSEADQKKALKALKKAKPTKPAKEPTTTPKTKRNTAWTCTDCGWVGYGRAIPKHRENCGKPELV